MKNKVACCYLTHDHPEVMDEVLGKICEPYGKKGIDIYVYDSGKTDDTLKITEKYVKQGVCKIHYVSMDFLSNEKGGDAKYLEIIKGYGLKGEYDYIWPTKDRCWFEGETLDRICEAIDEDHDVIFAVDERDRYEILKKPVKSLYSDASEFFADYGALLTNWECVIRRKDTMLDPIDWNRYADDYSVGKDNNFNQTVTTFVRLAEMNSLSVKVIESGLDDKRYSDKASPIWTSTILEIWIDRWIPAVFSLPSVYDAYKLNVIRTQLGHVSLFGSNDALLFLRDSGALTGERVDQLRSMWSMISRIPAENFERILKNDEAALFDEIYEEFQKSFSQRDYEKGYYLFVQNRWLSKRISKEDYRIIALSYYIYLKDMMKYEKSLLFEGVDSMKGLIARFKSLSGQTGQKG